MSTNQEKGFGIVSKMLEGMGVPSNWAKIIAGGIIGAIVTWMSLSTTSCSGTTTGDLSLQDGQINLSWGQSAPAPILNVTPSK